jgi:hypothetical protein
MSFSPRPGEALARFCEARGERIVELAGVLWVQYRRPFFQSLPYERRMDLEPGELEAELHAKRIVGVRYPTLTQVGWPSGIFVCDTRTFSIERLEPRRRREVQKGLSRCEIRPVDPDELLVHGPQLNLETMARQGRFDPEFGDPARWKRFVAAIRACPEVSIRGAFLDGRLAAYGVLCRDGAWQHLLFKMSRTADMVHGTNPAIDFAMLAEAASDPSLDGVTNSGLSFIHGSEQLHWYKQRLGYRLEHHEIAIRFHPALAPTLTAAPVVAAAAALSRSRPSDRRVELVARVLAGARRSRQGRFSPAESAAQAWPRQ